MYMHAFTQMYMCHASIWIPYRGVAEKLGILEIFDQPYLRNDFYGTKTKLYREASSIGVCGKEIQENYF